VDRADPHQQRDGAGPGRRFSRTVGQTGRAVRLDEGPEPNGAMSTRAFIEADCAGMQTRMLAVTDHSQHRGGGNVVATSRPKDWEPVAPSTVTARAWMYACTGK